MKESEAADLMAMMRAAFPNQVVEEPTVKLYARDLVDLDFDVTRQACAVLRQTARFFPTIAEIRQTAARLQLKAPEPMEAWEQAGRPGPRHELVDEARRLVGDNWHWRSTETHFLRKPFLESYAEVLRRAVLRIAAPLMVAPAEDTLELEPGETLELEEELVPAPPELLERMRQIGKDVA